SVTSPDPTPYVTKQRVTRPTPPAPSKNPMQFVQIKPCNLYQTAQEQLKKAEEVKKLKEVKKEEPEEWQNNLDNWKSSRRKRVEHIIDRAVETKKLELEEHDRLRRKSKTFTEMMEERAERGGPRGRAKLASLAVYNEDETNDLSDLGIGTSSASGKSSLSGDYDNNSVMQEELKRQRENLVLRENIARRELQHGAKMLMSNNRRSLQDLHHGLGIGNGMLSAFQPPQHQQVPMPPQHPQQIYANVPQQQQQVALHAYHQMDTDYRKSMSDLNEFSNCLMLPPTPPTKPLRAMQLNANGHGLEPDYAVSTRQRQPPAPYGGSLVKIAGAPMPPRLPGQGYPIQAPTAPAYHHQSAQNLSNMSRNTLLALSATPKPKYADGWVQVQQRKSYDSQQTSDAAWLAAQQQKRKSMPDYGGALYNNNHWLLQEAEQRRIEQLNRRSIPASKSMGKPLPDSIIQTLTERVQSKGIGDRKRFDSNGNYSQVNGNNIYQQQQQQKNMTNGSSINGNASQGQEKVLSVSGKKKCSHCGDELDLGCTHDNCRQVHKALKYIVWV
ncbi:GD19746, partial [Drosophila simulans]